MGNLGQGTSSEVPQGRARGRSHFLIGPSVTGDFPSSLLISISAQLLMSLQNSQGTSVLPRCSAQLLVGLCPASLRPGATTLSTLPGCAGSEQIQTNPREGCQSQGAHVLGSLVKNAAGYYRNKRDVAEHNLFPLSHSEKAGKMMPLELKWRSTSHIL